MVPIDLVVLSTILVGTLAAAFLLRRGGRRGGPFRVALWTSFYGLVVAAMMAAHSAEIVYHVVVGGTAMGGTPWAYDFRTYSLLLLGAVLLLQGTRCLRAAAGMGRLDPSAPRAARRATAVVLAVVAPLVPIHAVFGVMLTVLSAVGLVVLSLPVRRRTAPAAGAAPSEVPTFAPGGPLAAR